MSSRHWNRRVRSAFRNWWNSPKLSDYIETQIGGEGAAASGGVVTAVRARIGDRVLKHGVSIGCGTAGKEMRLLAAGVVEEFDLFEISQQRIERGRRELGRRGLAGRASYFKANAFEWPVRDYYDLVTWDHSLHHMSDVRAALAWSRDALAPGGLLVVNDYIGPNRLQWTGRDAALANGFFAMCETRYGIQFQRVERGDLISRIRMILKDPSEAPQSELIVQACRDVLGLELRPIGGALLNLVASQVLAMCEEHHPALDDLIQWDDDARRRGHSHFAFGVWTKPGG